MAAPAASEEGAVALSAREREIMNLVAAGLSNTAIRRELWISGKTLESHLRRIYAKLGIGPTTTEHRRVLAVLAWRRGIPGGSAIADHRQALVTVAGRAQHAPDQRRRAATGRGSTCA